MARRQQLRTMSLDQLVDLRDQLEKVLSTKSGDVQRQLAALGGSTRVTGGKRLGRPPGAASKLKRRKVAPKYRNPKNRAETWAGRGGMPRWLRAEIKAGKKLESFAIKR